MGTSLDEVVAKAVEKFGVGSVCKLNDKRRTIVPHYKTGIPQLDRIIGIGGLPKGRIIELSGPESCGKTTLALTVIANAQKDGAWAWYGDMEHSLDPMWAEKLGVNLDKLIISQPDHAEQCLDMAQHMVETGLIDIVVVDSVASLVPKAELEGESGDTFMGLQARLMSQAMRKMAGRISRTDSMAIFTNQIREKIGVSWGSNETSPGGRALKFYASIRIDVRRIGSVEQKKQEEAIGNVLKITIKKNKLAPPFKIAEADLIFKNGFDFGYNIIDLAVDSEVIKKEGHTYSLKEKILGKSRGEAIKAINSLDEKEKAELYDAALGICLVVEETVKPKQDSEIPKELPKEETDND